MILDGKKVANELKENLFKRIDALKKNKIFPCLSIAVSYTHLTLPTKA